MSDYEEPIKKEKPKKEKWIKAADQQPPYREIIETDKGVATFKHGKYYDVYGQGLKGVTKWKPMKG